MKTNPTASTNPLAALGARLSAYGLAVDLTDRGLRVTSTVEVVGCGYESAYVEDVITCRARPEDGEVVWFWDGAGEPITPVDRIDDAALVVRVRLGGRRASAAEAKR